MQILEDHNKQLEAQLLKLRQLLNEVSKTIKNCNVLFYFLILSCIV
jgi:hypothetical protein